MADSAETSRSTAGAVKARLGLLWDTLYNWRELWLWPLLAYIQLRLLIVIATHLQNGRPPEETATQLVGLGFGVLMVTVLIGLLSITRESNGTWWSKDDLKATPHLAWTSAITKIALAAIFAYVLTHW